MMAKSNRPVFVINLNKTCNKSTILFANSYPIKVKGNYRLLSLTVDFVSFQELAELHTRIAKTSEFERLQQYKE